MRPNPRLARELQRVVGQVLDQLSGLDLLQRRLGVDVKVISTPPAPPYVFCIDSLITNEIYRAVGE
jgi:hypothetical protein